MKAIEFKEMNVVYAKNQPEYRPLPAFKDDGKEGAVVFCQQLSFVERVRVLFTGKIWGQMLTFGNNLNPSFFTTKKSDVLISATPEMVEEIKPTEENNNTEVNN